MRRETRLTETQLVRLVSEVDYEAADHLDAAVDGLKRARKIMEESADLVRKALSLFDDTLGDRWERLAKQPRPDGREHAKWLWIRNRDGMKGKAGDTSLSFGMGASFENEDGTQVYIDSFLRNNIHVRDEETNARVVQADDVLMVHGDRGNPAFYRPVPSRRAVLEDYPDVAQVSAFRMSTNELRTMAARAEEHFDDAEQVCVSYIEEVERLTDTIYHPAGGWPELPPAPATPAVTGSSLWGRHLGGRDESEEGYTIPRPRRGLEGVIPALTPIAVPTGAERRPSEQVRAEARPPDVANAKARLAKLRSLLADALPVVEVLPDGSTGRKYASVSAAARETGMARRGLWSNMETEGGSFRVDEDRLYRTAGGKTVRHYEEYVYLTGTMDVRARYGARE